MKAFVWERINKVSDNYHEEGGLFVVAANIEQARVAANATDGVNLNLDDAPDLEYDVGNADPVVMVFPDAGCC